MTMMGERLGKWVLFRQLGKGGMGRVFLAQEEIGGRQAAVKVLAAELAQESGFLQRFQLEIETLAQLDHPNIVRFYEAGFENDRYFYAMEYVEGQSLEDVLEAEGRMQWPEVLEILRQICPALKHVHDHGVIHRDLKPANILRATTGEVKLTDFGIAKVFAQGHLTATGGVVGTAEYLSPEQAAGKPVTKRSDLYSLGAVLYTLLVGRPPFAGDNFLDMLHKHRYAQFDPPRRIVLDLPYEIDELVCQLLQKDPAKRPPDCLVLGRQVESIRKKLERKSSTTREMAPSTGTIAENKPSMAVFEGGPGPATLMSRLIREELERQNRGGPIARFFSKWYVIVPLFIVVMAILVWTVWPLSAEALFERGAELMQSKDPTDWRRAWREYLGPLESGYPDHPHKEEVARFKQKLDEHEQRQEVGWLATEGQRLFEQGERLRDEGQYAEALKAWKQVGTLFDGIESEKEWVEKAKDGSKKLTVLLTSDKRLAPVRAALRRAADLREQGKIEQAEAIWREIEAVYGDDPGAVEIMKELRTAKKK
jgi:predicted Ser/Thr protein kinase